MLQILQKIALSLLLHSFEVVKGMKELAQKISKKSYSQIVYLGEWHTHPNMRNSPSADDKKQFDAMYEQLHSEDLPFVQGIYGKNGLYINAKM